jgi:hypothetical protein
VANDEFRPFGFVFVSGSALAAFLVVILWVSSYKTEPVIFWSANGRRYDVHSGHGTVVILRLEQYQFNTPLNWGFVDPETPKQFNGSKRSVANHVDYSWWERVGYTVKKRTRFAGIECASGRYWPPFIWQHPRMPFTLAQLPYWAFLLSAASPAAVGLIRWVRRRRHRKSLPDSAE